MTTRYSITVSMLFVIVRVIYNGFYDVSGLDDYVTQCAATLVRLCKKQLDTHAQELEGLESQVNPFLGDSQVRVINISQSIVKG